MSDTAQTDFKSRLYEYEESYSSCGNVVPATYGLCATCNFFFFTRRQYGTENATCVYCNPARAFPNCSDPISTCSFYEQKGQTSLREMADIATYIDPHKNAVGFRK